MFSAPPATMTDASPHSIQRAAVLIASSPLPQMRFTVYAGTSTGSPAFTAAYRAMYASSITWPTQPRITWSTCSGFTPARQTASLIATAARSEAEKSWNAPPSRPIGVRHPLTTTTSSMGTTPFSYDATCDGEAPDYIDALDSRSNRAWFRDSRSWFLLRCSPHRTVVVLHVLRRVLGRRLQRVRRVRPTRQHLLERARYAAAHLVEPAPKSLASR